jgi:hypothetical protein
MEELVSPVYGERGVKIRYRACDLLWRPVGQLVRFVAVVHPTRGACLLMSTDLSLDARDIIRIYGLRFKSEHMFRQAVREIGSFAYHFWMMNMIPLRYRNGNQYLHRQSDRYRERIRGKIHAYHVFMQAGAIAQGLPQCLSVEFPKLVWGSFGSWLRTIRPGIPPSELVAGNVMRETLADFLVNCAKTNSLAKFIVDRQDPDNMRISRLVSQPQSQISAQIPSPGALTSATQTRHDSNSCRHVPHGIERSLSGGSAGASRQSYDPCQPHISIPARSSKAVRTCARRNYCRRYRPAARHAEAVDTSTSHLGFRCIIRERT